jgi:hypothetical protein
MRASPLLFLGALAACHASPPRSDLAMTSARMAEPAPVVSCAEWVRRAVESPELDVDRVPEPIAYEPPPIPKRLPTGSVGKDGRAEVRIKVLVDTLGHADMKTFTVVKSTSATLTRSVRTAVAKWTFKPAEVGGCKVPRSFNWGAVAGKPKAAK